jgi:hypothetical protein
MSKEFQQDKECQEESVRGEIQKDKEVQRLEDMLKRSPDLIVSNHRGGVRYHDGSTCYDCYDYSTIIYNTKDNYLEQLKEYEPHSVTNSLGTIKIIPTDKKEQINWEYCRIFYLEVNGRRSNGYAATSCYSYIIRADSLDDIRIATNLGVFVYHYSEDKFYKYNKDEENNKDVHIRGDYSYRKKKDYVKITYKGNTLGKVKIPYHICGFGKDYFMTMRNDSSLLCWKF